MNNIVLVLISMMSIYDVHPYEELYQFVCLIKYCFNLIYNMVKIDTITKRKTKSITTVRQVQNVQSNKLQPTDGESMFESYHSVLVNLLGTKEIYQKIVETSNYDIPVSVQEVKHKNANPKTSVGMVHPITYFYTPNDTCEVSGATHYKVYSYENNNTGRRNNGKRWTTIDPYDLYQKPLSQGFCQMFAYFIAVNDVEGFIDKRNYSQISKEEEKDIHKKNMYQCLKKTLNLIKNIKINDVELYQEILIEFEDIKQEPEYGIPDNMSFDDFIRDFEKFKIIDLNVMFNEMYSKN